MWTKIKLATLHEPIISECIIVDTPPKEQLKQMYSMYLGMLQKNMTCTGNDGTYDTFHGEIDIKMGPNEPDIDGKPKQPTKYSADIQMDEDYLMGGTSTITSSFTGQQRGL